MQRQATIREADNGYILTLPFPYGSYENDGEVICVTWAQVMARLKEAFDPDEKKASTA